MNKIQKNNNLRFFAALFPATVLCAVMLSFTNARAMKKIDGIVAVVGDSAILKSELDAYVFLKTSQMEQSPDSLEMTMLRYRSLDEIIEGKVLIVHAEKDSNITVSSNEVEAELENRIQFILRQNGITLEQFVEVLQQQQGIGLVKFKAELRKQIRQELIKQKVQGLYASPGEISRGDVESFFAQYKDSLPPAGASVLLSRITMKVEASDSIRRDAYQRIQSVKERLDEGEDFSDLARQFSEGPNASQGGDLGFITKGTLDLIRFEERAFVMKPGETTGPFETKLGFHILKCLGRKDQSVHIQQIFISVSPPESEQQRVELVLDSIRTHALDTTSFQDAVKKFSVHEMSRTRNGRMAWQEISNLDTQLKQAVENLSEGEITPIITKDNTLSIYRVDQRLDSRPLSLTEDWNEISVLAQRILAQQKLRDLVQKWRQETYIDIRL